MVWSLVAGIALLLLLLAAATQGWLASRPGALASSEEENTEPCPQELVCKVFSRSDWEFVHGLKAGNIERLFKQERKKVALVWVRQTSAMIRNVMREHVYAARHSKNLEIPTEVKILAQFLTVLAVCGVLSVSIRVAGPLWLAGPAQIAQRLAQRVRTLQESLPAGAMARAGDAGIA